MVQIDESYTCSNETKIAVGEIRRIIHPKIGEF